MRPLQRWPATARNFAPWRNGGGETAEILISPEAAGYDDFSWRISTAKVARSGPFSIFPGVQRCLAVVSGGSMRLNVADGTRHEIGPSAKPVYFPGDMPCDCVLLGAALLDLNLMFRAPFRGAMYRRAEAPPDCMPLRRFLFALEALPTLGLAPHDLADITGQPLPAAGEALVIEIRRWTIQLLG